MNNPQRKSESTTDNRYLSATHEVINQPRPLENYNLYEQDTALREAVLREGLRQRRAEGRVRQRGGLQEPVRGRLL